MNPELSRAQLIEPATTELDGTQKIRKIVDSAPEKKEGKAVRRLRKSLEAEGNRKAKKDVNRQENEKRLEAKKERQRNSEERQAAAKAKEHAGPFADLHPTLDKIDQDEAKKEAIAKKEQAEKAAIETQRKKIELNTMPEPSADWQFDQDSELGRLVTKQAGKESTVDSQKQAQKEKTMTIKEILEQRRMKEATTAKERTSIANLRKQIGIPKKPITENITNDELKSRVYDWKARASGFDPITESAKAEHKIGLIDQRGLRIEELSETTPPPIDFWGRLLDKTKQMFDPNLRDIRENQRLSAKAAGNIPESLDEKLTKWTEKRAEKKGEAMMKKINIKEEEKFKPLPGETDKTWKIDTSTEDEDWKLSDDSKLDTKNTWPEKTWKESVVGKGLVDKKITQIETGYSEAAEKRMARRVGRMPELPEQPKDTNTKLEELRKEAAEASWGFLGLTHPKFDEDGNITNLPGGDRQMLITDLDQRIKRAENKGDFAKQNKLEGWKKTLNNYLDIIKERKEKKANWEEFLNDKRPAGL